MLAEVLQGNGVSALGSIFVNGVEYGLAGATITIEYGRPGSAITNSRVTDSSSIRSTSNTWAPLNWSAASKSLRYSSAVSASACMTTASS